MPDIISIFQNPALLPVSFISGGIFGINFGHNRSPHVDAIKNHLSHLKKKALLSGVGATLALGAAVTANLLNHQEIAPIAGNLSCLLVGYTGAQLMERRAEIQSTQLKS